MHDSIICISYVYVNTKCVWLKCILDMRGFEDFSLHNTQICQKQMGLLLYIPTKVYKITNRTNTIMTHHVEKMLSIKRVQGWLFYVPFVDFEGTMVH